MSTNMSDAGGHTPPTITAVGRYLVLVVAFLGWMFAGVQMSITSLVMRPAAIDLMDRVGSIDLEKYNALNAVIAQGDVEPSTDDQELLTGWKALVAQWFAWYQCAFLFGAAAGGLIFGRLGDRIGRSKAMAASILCYSILSAAACLAQSPLQLLVLRFLACTGVGGMWPNGVSLVAEAWSGLSRPMVAGVIGTAANVGIFLMATIARMQGVTPDDWHWVMLIGGSTVVLGLFALVAVPESPRWLAGRSTDDSGNQKKAPVSEVFHKPFLSVTLIGIALATVPLIGGWGSANWMIPWADEAGETANPPNPTLKADVLQARALTGMVGSLLGGWIASIVGRRRCYFLVSLIALGIAQYAFWFTVPTDRSFLLWVGALGFFSGIYFGWLPLFLPELFPTRVRSTGAGVSFNFGRILTAVTIFATGALKDYFAAGSAQIGQVSVYAQIGRVTSLIYAVGILVILFAPDTSKKELED